MKPPFSYGFPMVFPWFHHSSRMLVPIHVAQAAAARAASLRPEGRAGAAPERRAKGGDAGGAHRDLA